MTPIYKFKKLGNIKILNLFLEKHKANRNQRLNKETTPE